MSITDRLAHWASDRDQKAMMSLFGIGKKKVLTPEEQFVKEMPSVANPAATKEEFAHALARPVVEAYRSFILNVLLASVAVMEAFALWQLMPLKEVKPWAIEVNGTTGEVRLNKQSAQSLESYKPAQPVLERELFTFVKSLYTLTGQTPKLTEEAITLVYQTYARDQAVSQVREFLVKDKVFERIKSIPGLNRTADKRSISFRSDAPVAFVRFATSERVSGQSTPIERNLIMQITYVLRPSNDPAEIERNPLGLYVTHFDVQEDR